MTRYIRAITMVTALGFALQAPALAQTPEDEVVDVVQRLLDAIGDRDSASFRALVLPQLHDLVVIPEADSVRLIWRETEGTIRSIGAPGPEYLERMW